MRTGSLKTAERTTVTALPDIDRPGFPRLVYRDLGRLCCNYLEWVDPLHQNVAERAFSTVAVNRFADPAGIGQDLQGELEELMAADEDIQRRIPYWNDWYLADRQSLPVNSNPFYLLELPSKEQAAQAAKVTFAACAFHSLVEGGKMEPDLLKGKPLCMEQYRCMFGTARSPRLGKDIFVRPRRTEDPAALPRHIVVIRRGSFFRVEVIDERGRIQDAAKLESLFRELLGREIANPFPVGALTSLGRDRWAKARESLLLADTKNEQVLETIERSLFTLSLDESAPGSRDEAARVLLHGNPGERWFDKAIQLIVCSNGVAGINFEHSHIDGSPMSRFVRFLTEPVEDPGSAVFETTPRDLEFSLPENIRGEIKAACDDHRALGRETLFRSLDFLPFGKEAIKQRGFSPDAFIMIALQLAQQRTWGYCRSIFESVMLRSFYRGRTEAMRPISRESIRFITAMDNRLVSDGRKRTALVSAGDEHVRRIRQCLDGEGVEGHLQALLLLWRRNNPGADDPMIFADEAWQRLTRNVFSTSTTEVDGLELGGYGQPVPEGFTFRFLKKADLLRFFISCRSGLKDELDVFTSQVIRSLEDMWRIIV